MYRRILVPLDGSELSQRALPHARAIATAMQAEIVLLRAIDPTGKALTGLAPAPGILVSSPALVTASEEALQAERQETEQHLAAIRQRLGEQGFLGAVSLEVVEGPAEQAIVEAVERLGCDLVVMATHGRAGLKRAILGSVADHVARNTPPPAVLLVGPEERES